EEDLPGATYHVTPLKPCTRAELDAAMARYFGYYGLTFVGPPRPPAAELNEIEALFYEATARAEHRYCGSDPEFDCTNTLRALPEWRDLRVDPEYLHRTIDFAVRNRFGRTRKRKPSAVPALGGRAGGGREIPISAPNDHTVCQQQTAP